MRLIGLAGARLNPVDSLLAGSWTGGPHDYRCVETFVWPQGGPAFAELRAACPRCGAEVPRR